ncbi:MAG: hypothetical protein AAGI11_23170 [Pseudomonadota bacterium]
MALLLALVGFAAVVAVYSTLVSVVVEGIHKIFALRSAGMSEMLRSFYDQKLADLQPSDTPIELAAPTTTRHHISSPQSRDFARRMTRRTASENLRPWYIRRWPIIGAILSSRLQRMSTLQFIERLAETPEGKALAGHDRSRLRRALTAAAYDFERLGEAQTAYFRSRANMVSVLAGIAVAFFVNLDAITLYKELAANQTLSARLAVMDDVQRVALVQGNASEGQSLTPGEVFASPEFSSVRADFLDMGVPVGRSMFPYCDVSVDVDGSDNAYRDARCSTDALTLSRLIGNIPTTVMWLLGVLLAGGLLGLGAPFWFRLFARGAAIVAPMARLTLTSPPPGTSSPKAEVTATVPADRLGAVRKPLDLRPAELERAYLTVLGRGTEVELDDETGSPVQPSQPPPGRIVGTLPPEVAPKNTV